MEFNYRFINKMLNGIIYNASSYYGSTRFVSHEHNNVFQKFINVTINNNELEVPCFCRTTIEQLIIASELKYKNYVIPMYLNSRPDVKRTGDAIVSSLFSLGSFGLKKVTDSKGVNYYGCSGLILNNELKPLLMTTASCELKLDAPHRQKKMNLTRFNIRINPIVFDSDGVVEKTIVKKLINLYTSKDVSEIYDINVSDKRKNTKAKIIIDDFDEFFATPKTPKLADCNNDVLNDVLVNNLDDITIQ